MKLDSHSDIHPPFRKVKSTPDVFMDPTVSHCCLFTKGPLHLLVFIGAFQRMQSCTLPRVSCCFIVMSTWSASKLSFDGQFLKHDKTIEKKNRLASRRTTLTSHCYLPDFYQVKFRLHWNECDILNQHKNLSRSMFVCNILMNFYLSW